MTVLKKLKKNNAFTLAEVMVVVAITIVLASVSFVAVSQYKDSFSQQDLDASARAIYLAAQNHLTIAESAGYLDLEDKVNGGAVSKTFAFGEEYPADSGVYYFVVPADKDKLESENSILNMMLPVGAVDESMRMNGNYIIRYQKSGGRVLDVFYAKLNVGSPILKSSNYSAVINTAGNTEEQAALRKDFGANHDIIGYFGIGNDGIVSRTVENYSAPVINIDNKETLRVVIDDYSATNTNAKLSLHIQGEKSGVEAMISINDDLAKCNGIDIPCTRDLSNYSFGWTTYTIVLDDITNPNGHFSYLFPTITAGDDLEVWAEVKSTSTDASVIESTHYVTNSLFASCEFNVGNTAVVGIENFRHFENLDNEVSGFTAELTEAEQLADLDWSAFCNAFPSPGSVKVSYTHLSSQKTTNNGCMLPVIGDSLNYYGNGNTIKNVKVNYGSSAGLFESLNNAEIYDLQLIDFDIKTSGNNKVGALAGYAVWCDIVNVVAFNSTDTITKSISTSTGNAGGLVGECDSCDFKGSSASLIVKGGSNVGGLIGLCSENSDISKCYSGGHTVNGAYSDANYNVVATGNAGGLIGGTIGSDWTVVNSYSTCSVKGSCAGGLIGDMSGDSSSNIESSYCTGLVSATTKAGAMIGSLDNATIIGDSNHYFDIINNGMPWCGSGTSNKKPAAFDETLTTYNAFVKYGGDSDAIPYDPMIHAKYRGNYFMPDVTDLGGVDPDLASEGITEFASIHHGDWPMPEVFVIQ